jgi:hypothetical protein
MSPRRPVLIAMVWVICAAAPLFAAGHAEVAARAIIDTGHVGPVLGLEFDDRRGFLFSAGEDGTVRIWDAASTQLVRTVRVSRLAATRIAVNPTQPQFAVVLTDGSGSCFLSVWDWEREKQLARIPLKEQPLFLRFSGMGTFLEYGESSWQSLKIIRALDGSPVPFHPEGFGIVGFAEMSRTEKTIMTYQVSGRLSYWDVASGQQTLDLPTVPYLSGVRLSRDKRYLVGFSGREVVIVDAQTGAVRARATAGAAVSVDMAPASDEIALAGASLALYGFAGGALKQRASLSGAPGAVSLVCYGTDGLFFADIAGTLAAMNSAGQVTPFGVNALAGITGMDAKTGRVAVSSRDWIRVFASDMLTGAAVPTYIRTALSRSPFATSTGLSFRENDTLLAWRADGAAAGLALLDVFGTPGTGSVARLLGPGFKAPLLDFHAGAAEALGVEVGGTVRIVDALTGLSRYEIRVPSAAAVVRATAQALMVGRTAPSAGQGSILRVNPSTGETVALRDHALISYALLADTALSGGAVLYSLGIDAAGATALVLHDGAGFDSETVLDTVPEEDLNSTMSLDPGTHAVYATLGKDRTVMWDGTRVRELDLSGTSPTRLIASDGLLFLLNRDSTVSVADAITGAALGVIGLFSDGEWCLLFPDGRYAASPGGDVHVRVFAGGTAVKATEDFRLRIAIEVGEGAPR